MKKLSKILLCALAVVAVAIVTDNSTEIVDAVKEFCIMPPIEVMF